MYFLIFHITLFTFCLGRPLIGMFTGEEWWNYASQAKENIWFALILLITSLIAMQLGVIAVEQTHKFVIKARGKKVVEQNRVFVHNLQFVALCMYILTMIFFFGTGNRAAYSNKTRTLFGILFKFSEPYSGCISYNCIFYEVQSMHFFWLHCRVKRKRLFHWRYLSCRQFHR